MKHKKISKKSAFKKLLVLIAADFAAVIAAGYIILLIYVYVNQDAMIFFPRPVDTELVDSMKARGNVKDLDIKTSDGNTLRGWLVNTDSAHKKPLVIYYGGNAEEVSDMIDIASKINDHAWALVNYRGYGASTGSPNEMNLYSDALHVYDILGARDDIDTAKISVFGKSLGSGVATYVAQQRSVNRVILSTPYDSVTSVAQERYPYFPVSLLLRSKFDSVSRAKDIHVPVLVLAAGNDSTIPISHAEKLAAAFGDDYIYKVIPDAGHNSIVKYPSYVSSIDTFLGVDD